MSEPTRQQLLDAAVRVYAEFGFRGATTRRIAEEAGVNEVTLFRLFGSKQALIFEGLRAHALVGAAKPLPETPKDPMVELTTWATDEHRTMFECRGMIRTNMAEWNERPETAPCVTDGPQHSHLALRGYANRLVEQGVVPHDAEIASASAMLMGALFADAMGREMMPEMFPPLEDAPATYVRLFLRSIGAAVPALT